MSKHLRTFGPAYIFAGICLLCLLGALAVWVWSREPETRGEIEQDIICPLAITDGARSLLFLQPSDTWCVDDAGEPHCYVVVALTKPSVYLLGALHAHATMTHGPVVVFFQTVRRGDEVVGYDILDFLHSNCLEAGDCRSRFETNQSVSADRWRTSPPRTGKTPGHSVGYRGDCVTTFGK